MNNNYVVTQVLLYQLLSDFVFLASEYINIDKYLGFPYTLIRNIIFIIHTILYVKCALYYVERVC